MANYPENGVSPSCTHEFSCRECKDSGEQNKASDDAAHGDGRATREHSEESGGDHAAAVLECADECRRRTRDLIRNFGERRRIGARGNNTICTAYQEHGNGAIPHKPSIPVSPSASSQREKSAAMPVAALSSCKREKRVTNMRLK